MADVKISALPSAGSATTAQVFPVVDGGVTKQLSNAQLITLLQSQLQVNQTGTGTPVAVKTPAYIGQFYIDLTAPYGLWISTGVTNADWSALISA